MTLHVVQLCPWMLPRWTLSRHSGVRGCWWGCPLPEVPIPLVYLRRSWSDPNMTALKWACHQVTVTFASPPFVIIPIALLITLDPSKTSTFLA